MSSLCAVGGALREFQGQASHAMIELFAQRARNAPEEPDWAWEGGLMTAAERGANNASSAWSIPPPTNGQVVVIQCMHPRPSLVTVATVL